MLKFLPQITPRFVSRGLLNVLRKSSCDAFERRLKTARQNQTQWLLQRVRQCANTDFGRGHGFSSIKSVSDFQSRIPIADYEQFAPYINEVAKGNTKALVPDSDQLLQFTITTGSSGVPKLNPVTRSWLTQYQASWNVWGMKLFVDHPQHIGNRMLQMAGTWNMGQTPGGHQISMVSALLARIQNPLLKPYYLIPEVVNTIPDPVARHYVALVLSVPRNVGWILLMNPGTLIRLAEIGNRFSDALLKDICDGTLNNQFDIPDHVRNALSERHLKRRPRQATHLARLAATKGCLLPKDYWHQPVVGCWLGGTAGYQSRYIDQYFGPSPKRDMGLVSSEGRHTIPLADDRPEGVPAIDSGFYEFLPADQDPGTTTEALQGHQLTSGESYRLIMTTPAGYYRFDIGDIIRCNGFVGEAPVLEFVQKSARVGDLEGEKLTEHQVIEAAHDTARSLGLELSLITAIPRRLEHQQPRYDFLVERQDVADEQSARQFLQRLDQRLAELNFLWRARRKEGVLQAPQLIRLADGEWDRSIREETDRRGTGDYQYKHPGLVVDERWMDGLQIHDSIDPGTGVSSS